MNGLYHGCRCETQEVFIGQGPPLEVRHLIVSLTLCQQHLHSCDLKLELDLGIHPPEGLTGTLDPFLHVGENNTIQMSCTSITGSMSKPCPQPVPK